MTFKEIDITNLKRSRDGKPVFRVSKGGSIGLNKSALALYEITEATDGKYAHFIQDENDSYWLYINDQAKNGIKIRFQVKTNSLEGFVQCTGFVKKLIIELDLPIAEDKRSSVRLDFDTENPVKIKGAGTAYKLF